MIPEPLNGRKDDPRPKRSIAGHFFDAITGLCVCGKFYSDISGAPESAISDDKQANLWCHQGTLTRHEWNQIQDENTRIMACCRG